MSGAQSMGSVNDIAWMRTRAGGDSRRQCEALGAELRGGGEIHKRGLHTVHKRPANVCLQPHLLQYFLLLSMGLCISTTFCRQSTGRIDQGAMSGWTSADRRTSFAQHPATTADILDAM